MYSISKVNTKDCFDDDNEGFIYGLEYYDSKEDLFPVDVEWFKTEKQRQDEVNRLKKSYPKVKIFV